MSFSTLYVGATGVVAHSDRMQVVANNLANVSTVGYKKADALFSDLMSQDMATGGSASESGAHFTSQIGKGVAIGEIRNIFAEGGLENTTEFTDLAITGNGFFGVRNTGGAAASTGASHFTRAGAFRFNNDAYLTDPQNYRVQGYAIDRVTGDIATSVSDVQLPYEDITIDGQEVRVIRSDPLATSSLEMVTTLDALSVDNFTSSTDPFFAMLAAYDGQQDDGEAPFGTDLPAYSSALNVYDEDGNEQALTIYFDPVATTTISNATPGYSYWEYLVALPGSSDGSSAYGTSAAGLAGVGIMSFDGSGQLVDLAAYEMGSSSSAGGKSLGAWTPATFDDDGIPQVSYTFGSNGSAVGTSQSISYNFGVSSTSGSWLSGAATAAGVGINAGNLSGLDDIDREVRASTSFNSGSATIYQNQNGYTWGYLENASVTREGVLSGYFSNGQTEDFYKIAMYRFNSNWGLRRDGANNFLATEASGAGMDGMAMEGGRGTIMQNTLEMSNVDMAQEFANMILTQRGYQANTKVITTGDALINTTINIKK
ncbi:flagellar hook-basal body complex protein [Pseudodesulfovibrio sp.]|nr:flagellar hook-basal body complex protein [Pseudodesulfovibrio sp.]